MACLGQEMAPEAGNGESPRLQATPGPSDRDSSSPAWTSSADGFDRDDLPLGFRDAWRQNKKQPAGTHSRTHHHPSYAAVHEDASGSTSTCDRQLEEGEERKGKRAWRWLAPRRLCLKSSCRRFREQQRRKWARAELRIRKLEMRASGHKSLEQENDFLRVANGRLASVAREQQEKISELTNGQRLPSFINLRLGLAHKTTASVGRTSGTDVPPKSHCRLRGAPSGPLHQAEVQSEVHDAKLMDNMGAKVQALRSFLVEKSILKDGARASEGDVRVIQDMLSTILEVAVGVARTKVPKPCDLASGRSPKAGLSEEGVQHCRECLGALNLTAQQMLAISKLASEQEAQINKIYESRSALNDQARVVLRKFSAASQEMRSVWSEMKQNVRREYVAMVDGLRELLMTILEPVQAALLIVDAQSAGADALGLVAALACAFSASRAPAESAVDGDLCLA
ncbi:unnamed protein product [Ostreobium quekettii]|uniref:Uncharacterized protein n=1 Tax=Ostreobium quekettii TaxID=121088 RepID=A0A8S1IMK2_9CHLO|nr:unnamed protein product [Ostreobium quekettii]